MKYVHVLKNETEYRSKLHEKEIRIWVLFQQCCSFRSFLFQHIRSLSASLYLNIFHFFFVADRCHTPICRCDRNHILENILIVEKKINKESEQASELHKKFLLPNVLHILEKIVPCKTYSSSIFHWRSKKKVLIQTERKERIYLCRVTKTKYFRSTRLWNFCSNNRNENSI